MILPRLYDYRPAPSPASSFYISPLTLFIIKWATHGDVVDAPLCGLHPFYSSLSFLPYDGYYMLLGSSR